jgi:chaperone required for assembly of F1-ATPase
MQQEQKRKPKIKSMTKTSILIIVINNVFCKHQVTDPVRKIKDKLKIINFSPQKNYMTLNNQTSICRSMIMSLLKRNSHISLKFRLKVERAFPINKMLSK